MAVTAARRAARDAGQQPPDGPLTRQALEEFRRTEVAAARRRQTRGLTADECDAILATCTRRRRSGRGLERKETAERRGLIDGAIVGLLFHGALRRSEVAALRWADVDLSDGVQHLRVRPGPSARLRPRRAEPGEPDVRAGGRRAAGTTVRCWAARATGCSGGRPWAGDGRRQGSPQHRPRIAYRYRATAPRAAVAPAE